MKTNLILFLDQIYKLEFDVILFWIIIAYMISIWAALIFWTLRDAFKRSRSKIFYLLSFLLVGAFNIFGLLIYILIRPNQTLVEDKIEKSELEIFENFKKNKKIPKNIKSNKVSKSKKIKSKK